MPIPEGATPAARIFYDDALDVEEKRRRLIVLADNAKDGAAGGDARGYLSSIAMQSALDDELSMEAASAARPPDRGPGRSEWGAGRGRRPDRGRLSHDHHHGPTSRLAPRGSGETLDQGSEGLPGGKDRQNSLVVDGPHPGVA